METFCTVITAEHLPFAKVLHASLDKLVPGTALQVLVIDKNEHSSASNFIIHQPADIAGDPVFKKTETLYAHSNPDHFRWALKPVFITYLLAKGFSKVIFVDPDIYFVADFSFLFDKLDRSAVLLTPHWANLNPTENEDNLFSVLRGGLFNAGFVGSAKEGADAMNWWAGMCLYKMERRQELGIYDDQKYLDILPVQFDGVEILKHQGCNLASWNIDTCKRELIDGKLMINTQYEPVFIHFAKDTIVNILNRNDALLKPYLDEYAGQLKKEGIDLYKNIDHHKFESAMYSVKHKLRLRTRIKRFFFRLAEKL